MQNKQFIFLKSKVSDQNPKVQIDTDNFIKEMDITNIAFPHKIFFIQSGGTEEIFVKIYQQYKAPYYLIATDANNSLPSALEIVSFLRSKNLEVYLFHGEPKKVAFDLRVNYQNNIVFNNPLTTSEKLLSGERFGVIGKPSDWLIASHVDYPKANEKFGVEFVDVSFEDFKALVIKSKPVGMSKFNKHVNKIIPIEEVRLALKIYSALKYLVKKHNLTGLTVRCFDLLGSVHTTSCLALSLLNDEGITSSCEGDIPALISMAIIKRYFKKPSFQCNPSYVDIDNNVAYLAHCTLPLKMTKSFSLNTHFESGIGVGIHGEMKTGKITILKINSDLEKYSVYSGKLVENLYKDNLCRTQIKVSLDEPTSQILTSPCGNHLIVAYGDFKSALVALLSLE